MNEPRKPEPDESRLFAPPGQDPKEFIRREFEVLDLVQSGLRPSLARTLVQLQEGPKWL